MKRDPRNNETLASDALAEIEEMSRAELKAKWEEKYQRPPPTSMSSRLLRYALSFEAQASLLGGESKASAKAWAKIEQRRAKGMDASDAVSGISAPRTKPLPDGSRLIRVWKGRTHEVTVLDTDQGQGRYLWNDRAYRSLSAIARQITGTNRNGPSFFGLRETAS